jgi:hypothetical protein
MPNVTAYYILSCTLLAGPVQAGQEQTDDIQGMFQADRGFIQAIATGNKVLLEPLLDTEFTWTDLNGKTQTRADVLRTIPKSAIKNEDVTQFRQFAYGDLGDIQMNNGKTHVLRVWVKRGKGWKAIVYQEVRLLDAAPAFTPGAGADCENPCKTVPYQPKNTAEKQVIAAYSKLETAAMAHNSAVFATLAGDEFVAVSSNSNKAFDKQGRLAEFAQAKMGGLAPTPLVSARMFGSGDAVLMISEHKPDRGKPLHVTRIWVKRKGTWMEMLSYQTAVQSGAAAP